MPTATRPSAPAGSRRFWVTVLCFFLANVCAWIVYDRIRRPHAILEVRQSAPSDAALVSGRPTFWWTFNLDVAPTHDDQPPGEIRPPLAGRWKWENPRTLSFVPDKPLPKASDVAVILLPQRLHTPEGFGLKKPYPTKVHTAPLQVLSVRQMAIDERDRVVLEIEFDDEVIPAEVLSHLTVRSAEDKPVGITAQGEAIGHTVRVITDALPTSLADPSKSYLKLQLAPGLAGRSGPLGLEGGYSCNLPIGSELIATGASTYYAGHDEAILTVQFNNSVDLLVLRPLISVDPKVQFSVTGGDSAVQLHGPFQPATRYAIRIAKAPAGVARSACPRPDTLSVYVPDRAPEVWFEHEEGYLGSAGNRTLLAHAVNLTAVRASITRVYDNNLVAWRNSRGEIESFDRPVATRVLKLPAEKNETQDLRIELDDLLPAGDARDGVYCVNLEPLSSGSGDEGNENRRRRWRGDTSAVVTLSDVGLTAKRGRTGMTVWATSLRTAQPLPHVRVRLFSTKNQSLGEAVTGDDGLATLAPAPTASGEEPAVLIADRKAGETQATTRDLTWLDLRSSRANLSDVDTSGAAYLRSGYEAFIYTERGVYRPGETVHLRAIVRGPDGATPPAFPVQWRFRRPDLHAWRSLQGSIDSDGAVSLDLPLPADLPTGLWSVRLGLPGTGAENHQFGEASFQVEDFMPNRMQVAVKLGQRQTARETGNHALLRFPIGNDPLVATVQADYLFGKPVSGRPVRVAARMDPATFAPPQWKGWSFGDTAATAEVLQGLKLTGRRVEVPEQILDQGGTGRFALDLESVLAADVQVRPQTPSRLRSRTHHKPSVPASMDEQPISGNRAAQYVGPWRLSVTASVIDAGGRAVSASEQADIDPVDCYIALRRTPATPSNARLQFELSLVRPDGTIAARDAELTATLYRESWNNSLVFESGHYVYHSTRLLEPVQKDVVVRIPGGRGTVAFEPAGPGSYIACIDDPQSGSRTSLAFYSGAGAWEDNIGRANPERLELIVRSLPSTRPLVAALRNMDFAGAFAAVRSLRGPSPHDCSTLRTGESAQVIVRSPFAGRLLLSVETDDILSTRVIDMPASHMAVPIQITDACRPNAYVSATVIRAIDPDATWRTHRAIGVVRIPLDKSDRRLRMQITAPPEIRPATSLAARVWVSDSAGMPIKNAAVTVAAVDEGICQLTDFATPDPLGFFTRHRSLGVNTADLYSQLMPEIPKPKQTSSVGGDKNSYDPRHTSPISARRVKPVALVCAVLHTDENGEAQANFNVPQFTGRLRLMAVASRGALTGSGDSAVLVRSPLLVQSSWPRFAAPGDKFTVPILVFNNTPRASEATVRLRRIDGPLIFAAGTQTSLPPLKLPADGQATASVDVTAAEECGVSHVVLSAKMGDEVFEENVELPIRPASPEITRGGYAVATPAQPAKILVTGGMLAGTSRLQVTVTPWPALNLPQGLDYLERYPYGCLEQTTSTLLPLVYLSDIGRQIAPGVFDKGRISDKVQVGITRLIGMQTSSGGLAMWPGYREPWPWGSVYAAHFLVEARRAGYGVPDEFYGQVLAYVRGLLDQSSDDPGVLQTQAYGCYVLALAGKPERAVMSRLTELMKTERPDSVARPAEARLHLSAAWLAAGRRDLAESLIPQTLPVPSPSRRLSGTLSSPVRDRAILVNTLLAVQPDHPALAALVQQLAAAGRNGQWQSTQDTAFAVLALGRYLKQNQSAAPYSNAELLVDAQQVAGAVDGQSICWMAPVSPGGSTLDVRVTGADDVKAHVAWVEAGVPLKPPAPADHGMKVRRRYLDEQGRPLQANRVASGDLVQVELSISSDTPLQNLVIEDLLPAGLEIENPRLQTTGANVAERPSNGQANVFADTRLDIRDDRLVIVGDLVSAGTGRYVYTARAVTPGHFVLPPVHAECMYDRGANSLFGGGSFDVAASESRGIADVHAGN